VVPACFSCASVDVVTDPICCEVPMLTATRFPIPLTCPICDGATRYDTGRFMAPCPCRDGIAKCACGDDATEVNSVGETVCGDCVEEPICAPVEPAVLVAAER
jgi:hypothetical protein